MAEEKRDYYEVLGISKNASEAEIKKAFRTMARKYHPDLHPNDKDAEKKFKEVNEAYEVLSDPQKKARYDQFGFAGVDPNYNAGAGAGPGFGGFSTEGFGDIGDIFDSIFGGGLGGFGSQTRHYSNPNTPRKGGDLRTSINIEFMEACKGTTKRIRINPFGKCPDCNGTGKTAQTVVETCPDCRGSGYINMQQRTAFGNISTTRPCSRCAGKGQIIKNPCKKCGGTGRFRSSKEVEVKIPAGIANGQTLRLAGEGDYGFNGGPFGNLDVTINVKSHELFTREGNDIHCEIPISYYTAVMGGELQVPTIDGPVQYTVPEGTQGGTVFRLRSKGVQRLGNASQRGDEYVRVSIEVPKKLNEKQKKVLWDFENSLNEKNYIKRASFSDKVKRFFNNLKK